MFHGEEFTRPGRCPGARRCSAPPARHARVADLGRRHHVPSTTACCRGSIATTWPTSALSTTSVRSTPSIPLLRAHDKPAGPPGFLHLLRRGRYAPAGKRPLLPRAHRIAPGQSWPGRSASSSPLSSPTPTSTTAAPYPYYARFTDPAYTGPKSTRRCPIPRWSRPSRRARSASDPWPLRGLRAGPRRQHRVRGRRAAPLRPRPPHELIITGRPRRALPDRKASLRRNGAWLDPDQFRVPARDHNPPVRVARPIVRATRARDLNADDPRAGGSSGGRVWTA